MCIAVGMAVDFVVHLAHSIAHSHRREVRDRVAAALDEMGPSISVGALTTFLTGLFMLLADMQFFFGFGQFLALCMVFAWFFAAFFFCPLLIVTAPLVTLCGGGGGGGTKEHSVVPEGGTYVPRSVRRSNSKAAADAEDDDDLDMAAGPTNKSTKVAPTESNADVNDPNHQAAATKIQAVARGKKERRKRKGKKHGHHGASAKHHVHHGKKKKKHKHSKHKKADDEGGAKQANFCNKCGAHFDGAEKFCNGCGEKRGGAAP